MKYLKDTIKSATEAKVHFGTNYQMYKGWCAQMQFTCRETGEKATLGPVTRKVYGDL